MTNGNIALPGHRTERQRPAAENQPWGAEFIQRGRRHPGRENYRAGV